MLVDNRVYELRLFHGEAQLGTRDGSYSLSHVSYG
jgi:hypothetical protein